MLPSPSSLCAAIALIALTTGSIAQDADAPLTHHSGDVRALAFSPDGAWLASAGGEGEVRVWNVAEGTCLRTIVAHKDGVDAIAFATDGLWILSGGNDKTVKLWNRNTGECAHTFEGHDERVLGLAIAGDGKRFASTDAGGAVWLWDLAKRERIARATGGHESAAACIAFGPKDKLLYSGGWDRKLRTWTVPELYPKGAPSGNEIVLSMVVDRQGKHLATGSREGHASVFRLKKLKRVANITTAAREVRAIDLHPSPKRPWLVVAGLDGRVELWDYKKEKKLHDFHGHTKVVLAVRFSPDGKWIATGSDDTDIRFWRVPKK